MNPLGPNYPLAHSSIYEETPPNDNNSIDEELLPPILSLNATEILPSNDMADAQLITTDLTSERPDWIPQAAISKAGTLSTKHFLYFLGNQMITKESQEALKWFFQQRKFPPTVSCDTFIFPQNMIIKDLKSPVDNEGYAISLSGHASHTSKFILDNEILSIIPVVCTRYLNPTSLIPVGVYSDHKVIIQQQATRGCVAACAAMIIEDHQRQWKEHRLTTTNLANETQLISWLEQAELHAAMHTIRENIGELKTFIEQYGSIICMINGELGGHAIILDQINSDQAIIREPFHGWRIAISTHLFMAMAGINLIIIYVK